MNKELLKEKLKESLIQIKEEKVNINPKDIFDINLGTGYSYYDELLDFSKSSYYKQNKNVYGIIEYMTPKEYYEKALYIFKTFKKSTSNLEDIKRQRSNSVINLSIDNYDDAIEGENKLEYLKKCILKGKKMKIAYLDYKNGEQEGLHRMLAVSQLVGEDKKFPVLVVRPYTYLSEKELEQKIKEYIKEGTESQEGKEPELPTDRYYTKDTFISMVWDLIESKDTDINVTDIRVSDASQYSKTRSMNIYVNYFEDSYQFAISLRNPKDLMKPWFDIVDNDEDLVKLTGYDPTNHPFGDLSDEDIDDLLADD